MLAMVAAGCKKKDKVKPVESGISPFLTEVEGLRSGSRNTGPWELGAGFSVEKTGNITQLGVRLRDPGRYRVSLWDYETHSLLRQKIVEQTAPETFAYEDIEPLRVEPEKWFTISVNTQVDETNRYYFWYAPEAGGNLLPKTVGKVTIHESMYNSTAQSRYPGDNSGIKNEMYGLPDFKFKPD